jgi:coenzyme Q-binding protein COQ10
LPSHAERRTLPYRADQLFDLVADIEGYPAFLPWCVGARIRERRGNEIHADLVIGFKLHRERFTSRVILHRPDRIDVTYSEGPFRHLENRWLFEPTPGGGCIVDFHVAFELRSKLLGSMLDLVFGEAVRRMVGAFEARARKLYGPSGQTLPAAEPAV